jgi:tRNA modification GTPase
VDGSVAPHAEDFAVRDRLAGLAWIPVSNKTDLGCVWSTAQMRDLAGDRHVVAVSARTCAGIDVLRQQILDHLFGDGSGARDGVLVTNLRHCQAIEASHSALTRACEALRSGLSEEFALFDLHHALAKLGEVTGETTIDDLLSQIFSRFCIGK